MVIKNISTFNGIRKLNVWHWSASKFENDQFEVKLDEGNERKFLIPTAEVILTNIVKDKILDLKSLPMNSLLLLLVLEKKLVVMEKIQKE